MSEAQALLTGIRVSSACDRVHTSDGESRDREKRGPPFAHAATGKQCAAFG